VIPPHPVKNPLHEAETETVSDARPTRLDPGTANLSQPWVFAVLTAVHLGCLVALPWLASGAGRLAGLVADAVAMTAAAAVLGWWVARRRPVADPLILVVLLLALVAAAVRAAVVGSPWGGLDVIVVAIGTTTVRDRRAFTTAAVATPVGWAAVTAVSWWRFPEPGASWLVTLGMVIIVTGLVAVLRAGIVALEQTLDDLRHTADEQAVLDALTGAANRRGLEMLALPMIENARRQGQAVHCLFVDVDGFSMVNDAAGRAGGDEVLVALAEALKTSVRATDAVARWAGDEFIVLGPGTGTSPLELERRLRAHLAQVSPVPESVWPARVSIGSATLVPWDDGDLTALLGRAEQDMRLRRTLRRQSRERSRTPAPSAEHPVVRRSED
jgi:diguanylate cyclase (GGDEF)-like protein